MTFLSRQCSCHKEKIVGEWLKEETNRSHGLASPIPRHEPFIESTSETSVPSKALKNFRTEMCLFSPKSNTEILRISDP